MLEVVYGSKSEMVNKPDNRSLIEAIAKSNVRVGVLMPLYYLKGTFLERYLFPGSIVARYTFIAFVKSLLKDKKARSHAAERPSVYSVLMDSNGGEGLEPNQIAAESTNLIVAGKEVIHSSKVAADPFKNSSLHTSSLTCHLLYRRLRYNIHSAGRLFLLPKTLELRVRQSHQGDPHAVHVYHRVERQLQTKQVCISAGMP